MIPCIVAKLLMLDTGWKLILLLDDDSICFNHTEVRLGGWVFTFSRIKSPIKVGASCTLHCLMTLFSKSRG
ncbi:hypothetical protein RchiOBHm_Chr3g0490441 [Rosa chinensis]|uniref:Uncharacterized protein n=1 Tax=Rosa chinensis TaxID=74649 RepID=A0A2P6RG11_ROSCH|nr:hypothetical protein RchiOBHm_Chr3g0490441 [Rosa chinensis]